MARPPLSASTALALLADTGYTPLEPYPGSVAKPWKARCTTCGIIRILRLQDLRRAPDRRRCKHTFAGRRLDAPAAVALLAHYGFEPYHPYPGKVRVRWRVRCTACRQLRSVCLSDLARDPTLYSCSHTTPHSQENTA